MQDTYIAPKHEGNSFTCPHCHSFANMEWDYLYTRGWDHLEDKIKYDYWGLKIATCKDCNNFSFWQKDDGHHGHMLYPAKANAPMPHPDMPEDILSDFNEARLVLVSSPRASAALLRLCVQKLCNHLCGGEGNINSQIKKLVKEGLNTRVQKALDTVRVVGNNSVHPGELSSDDVKSVADSLFQLVNYIVDDRISRPKQVDNLFEGLPEKDKAAIKRRDEPKDKTA